jgi:hypothetical protein
MSAAHGLAFALLACGCATGGKDNDGPVDAPKAIDSSNVTIDAPRQIDAPNMVLIDAYVPPDAFVPQDAPSGPFCNGNSECTVAGQCCFSLGGPGFCVPGTPVAGACLPD